MLVVSGDLIPIFILLPTLPTPHEGGIYFVAL